jgi:glutamate formiminotransferase / 5-formyltetrahydrofolate cyclo-ligase
MIECVPNVSEGRRRELVDRIADAVRSVPGVSLLDYSCDSAHNRSVFTFAAEASALSAAVLALYREAVSAIDLRDHQGVHPRLGAVDVVPFVPLEGSTMADCVSLATDVGRSVAEGFGVPVYLYEEAATSSDRRSLAAIRRGGFEKLAERMAAGFLPDFGPPLPHATAGASVIGARMPLIAFNVNLSTNRLDVADAIARSVRQSSGGLRFVRALGLPLMDRGIVQVSMNLTNYPQTSIRRAFEAVAREAARRGVNVLESEIVGLAPAAALDHATAEAISLRGDWQDKILERRIRG